MARETILISSEESDHRTTSDDALDGTSPGSDGYSGDDDTSSNYDTHDSPIIFLNSPTYTISEKFVLIKDYIDGLRFTTIHDDFDRYSACACCSYLQLL